VSAKRIGVIAGAFNPVTRAHVALAEAASALVDEIVFAVPRAFPHKEYSGATLENRIEMIHRASSALPASRVEVVDGGLFVDIAREVRRSRPDAEIYLICGRDAAERILSWNYEPEGRPKDPDALARMFEEFHLLVAGRQGAYQAPDHLRSRIHSLELPGHLDEISSTEVRRRVAAGEPWEHFVPDSIVDLVVDIYGAGASDPMA